MLGASGVSSSRSCAMTDRLLHTKEFRQRQLRPPVECVLRATISRAFTLKLARRFFVGLRLLQGHHLRLRSDKALLSDLGLQGLEPFPPGLQIMPEPDASDARRGDRQGSFPEFVRHAE